MIEKKKKNLENKIEETFCIFRKDLEEIRASLVTQIIKKPPNLKIWIWSLDQEIPWKREWQAIPAFLPGEFYDGGASWAIVHMVTKSQT